MSNLPITTPDLVCVDDLDLYARETTSDLESLIQDVLHVLKELPGSNPDDPDRGIGVEQYLSGTESSFASLPGKIEEQLGRDDRISAVSATVARVPNGTFVVSISISVAGTVIPLQYGFTDGVFTNQTV